MPRRSRLLLPEVPLHIIQRGNNRQPCFLSDRDCRAYLDWLGAYSVSTGCRLHAYVLMSNHIHLLISADTVEAPGALMKLLGQDYAQYFNWRHARTGTLWEGRYKSCLVQDETYLLACQRYIELNPVRAGMVAFPAQYRWSSYRCNALGQANSMIQPHEVYRRLGGNALHRQSAYRALFQATQNVDLFDEIRLAINGSTVLGDAQFQKMVAERCRRPASLSENPINSKRPGSDPWV
ncbi:MAG: transposase [Pseudomonadota bacterium]